MKIKHETGYAQFLSTASGLVLIDMVPYRFVAYSGNRLSVAHSRRLATYVLPFAPTDLDHATIFFGPDYYQVNGWKNGMEVIGPLLKHITMLVAGVQCTDVTVVRAGEGTCYLGMTPIAGHARLCSLLLHGKEWRSEVLPDEGVACVFVPEPCNGVKIRTDGDWFVPQFRLADDTVVIALPKPSTSVHVLHTFWGTRSYSHYMVEPTLVHLTITRN